MRLLRWLSPPRPFEVVCELVSLGPTASAALPLVSRMPESMPIDVAPSAKVPTEPAAPVKTTLENVMPLPRIVSTSCSSVAVVSTVSAKLLVAVSDTPRPMAAMHSFLNIDYLPCPGEPHLAIPLLVGADLARRPTSRLVHETGSLV